MGRSHESPEPTPLRLKVTAQRDPRCTLDPNATSRDSALSTYHADRSSGRHAQARAVRAGHRSRARPARAPRPGRAAVLGDLHRVPTAPCPYHQRLAIDTQTGQALTLACRAGRDWEERDFLVWPATVRRFLADGHRDLPSPPVYAPGCVPSGERTPPVILTPQPGQVSIVIPGIDPAEQEIPLSAEVDRPDARLSWFVDGLFLGTGEAEDRMWWVPTPGEHVAVVVDDAGLRASRAFTVSTP